MKNKLRLIMTGVILATIGFAGCANKEKVSEHPVPVTRNEMESVQETTEETLESDTEGSLAEQMGETKMQVLEKDAVMFAKELKLGWNLGNTLDANAKTGMESETSWGMPKVTKELLVFVKECGFTTIRIPVSWGNHCNKDYQIDPEWMDRVQEILDWALEENFYVIINAHHDNKYYYPSEENLLNGKKYLSSIWTQIGERFRDYDERLVFEGMNEPRLEGTSKEWYFTQNDAEGIASIKCIMEYNQVFVDTVRKTGGNNTTRFLMVTSNAASPEQELNQVFEMPKDVTEGRLLLSTHAYTPYDFTMNEAGYGKWTSDRLYEFKFMEKLKTKFIDQGYGVVIGEFGVTNKDNMEDRIAWAKDYTEAAATRGIPCIIWDNNEINVGNENFGLLDRNHLTVYFPELLEAYKEYYNFVRTDEK